MQCVKVDRREKKEVGEFQYEHTQGDLCTIETKKAKAKLPVPSNFFQFLKRPLDQCSLKRVEQ